MLYLFSKSIGARSIIGRKQFHASFLIAALSVQCAWLPKVSSFTFTNQQVRQHQLHVPMTKYYSQKNEFGKIRAFFYHNAMHFKASMSDDTGPTNQQPTLTHVDKIKLQEILFDAENGIGNKNYVIIDVRGDDEVSFTGKIHPIVHTLPLPEIAMKGAFNLDPDDFKETFGFSKPTESDTLVFTCKAGIRSQQAAQFAAMSGYVDLVNYVGGADDWFRKDALEF